MAVGQMVLIQPAELCQPPEFSGCLRISFTESTVVRPLEYIDSDFDCFDEFQETRLDLAVPTFQAWVAKGCGYASCVQTVS